VIEVERMVNGCGLASLAGSQLNVGLELAGQRITLRMDGTQMAVISHDGHRLRGARRSASAPPSAGPVIVQRRVSQRGQIMVATQRIQVGLIHARKIATVTAASTTFEIEIDGQTAAIMPRTTSAEIHRYKAYATKARSSSGS
jgi:hypothetical protein